MSVFQQTWEEMRVVAEISGATQFHRLNDARPLAEEARALR